MDVSVSVIVPMFNMEKYIERCAKSLFEQTYKNIEFIFVDDHSHDNTLALLKQVIELYRMTDRVKLFVQPQNVGLALNRWRGVEMASGDYVIPVDSDDYVASDYIEKLVLQADKDNADVVICDYWYDYGHSKRLCHINPPLDAKTCLKKLLVGEMHNGVWNKLVRRSLYTDNGVHVLPGVNMFEDKILMTQLFFYARRVSYVSKPLYYYNRSNVNSITLQAKSKLIPQAVEVVAFLRDFFGRNECDNAMWQGVEYFMVGIMGLILLYGEAGILSARKDAFFQPSFKSIVTQPVVPFHYKWAVLAYRLNLSFLIWPLRKLIAFRNKNK